MWANDWLAAQHAADQRRFTQLLGASFALHLLMLALAAFGPGPAPVPLPAVLRVDLVAGLPAPAAAPAPKAASRPAPAPTPPKAAPKPVPKPKQVVLPKQAPKAVPRKRPPPPPARREPIEYDDALAQLRNELGEQTPPDKPPGEAVSDDQLRATAKPAAATSAGGKGKGGSTVDPDVARWVLATQRHVRDRWITPPEFLNRGLTTIVEVKLNVVGDVIGTPRVARPSGDPFFDDNAVRAVMASSPLPPPPSAGKWTFSFTEN